MNDSHIEEIKRYHMSKHTNTEIVSFSVWLINVFESLLWEAFGCGADDSSEVKHKHKTLIYRYQTNDTILCIKAFCIFRTLDFKLSISYWLSWLRNCLCSPYIFCQHSHTVYNTDNAIKQQINTITTLMAYEQLLAKMKLMMGLCLFYDFSFSQCKTLQSSQT